MHTLSTSIIQQRHRTTFVTPPATRAAGEAVRLPADRAEFPSLRPGPNAFNPIRLPPSMTRPRPISTPSPPS